MRNPYLDTGVHEADLYDGEYRLGNGDADVSVRIDTYSLSRAVFGRRSRAQIESWDWTGSPGEFAERITVMPKSEIDLVDCD